MYKIKTNEKEEVIIKNSKFIALSFYVENEDEIKGIINEKMKEYKDFTHLTYAYKIKNKEKAFDDNEPSGTAGVPILEVIKKNKLENILIIVIRYFGGIKLGAGSLIRAYSKAAREVLKKSHIEKYIKYNSYLLNASYDDLKLLNTLTNNLNIETKDFKEHITYKIKIEEEKDNIKDLFKETNINIKEI